MDSKSPRYRAAGTVGRAWTNADWAERFGALRRDHANDPRTALVKNDELCQGLLQLSAIVSSYRDSVDDFDDLIRDAVFGTDKRAGILQAIVDMDDVPQYPKTWAVRVLTNRLIDVLRQKRRRRFKDDPEAIDGLTLKSTVTGVSSIDTAAAAPPEALPRSVARTLHEVVQFSAIAIELAAGPHASATGLGLSVKDVPGFKKSAASWSILADCIDRDVGLGPRRLRWLPSGLDAKDGWARAWQSSYHVAEDHRDYVDHDEQPANKSSPASNLYYKHVERFREAYGECTGRGAALIQTHATSGGPLREPSTGKVRLPLAWSPTVHASLESNRQAQTRKP